MSRLDRIVQRGVPLILLLNALWMLALPSFPTLDGWTHLHTARMLMDGSLGEVYCPNTGLVPNRLGHLLLGLLQLVFPALVAERLLLAGIVWLLGWGTWRLARAFGGGQLLVLLVLPFTWNFMLVLGFHNFLLGTGLALAGAAWWVGRERLAPLHLLALAGLALLLFATHAMALGLFLLLTGLNETGILFGTRQRTKLPIAGRSVPGWLGWGLALVPALTLLLVFQGGHTGGGQGAVAAAALTELKDLRILTLYSGWDEGKFAYAMKLVLLAAVVVALVARFGGRALQWQRPDHGDLLLAGSAALAFLLFMLPDSTGLVSYIHVRLQFMAFLLFIAWLATLPVGHSAALAPVVILLLLHQARLRYIQEATAHTAEPRDLVLQAAQGLPEGSVVLPISYEPHWVLGHISSLLAVERPITLLDNYECSNSYFPLRWCDGLPQPLLDHLGGSDRCLHWLEEHIAQGAWPHIDHIVVIGRPDDEGHCSQEPLELVLERHFIPAGHNSYVRTFARRSAPGGE